jgi:hypothetical protein
MDELRKTPERMSVADVDDGIDTYSPFKRLARPVAGHNAEEVAQRIMPTVLKGISEEDMWKFLGKEREEMKKKFPNLPTMANTVKHLKQFERSDPYKRYAVFLNSLSDVVHEQLGWSTNAAVINKLTSPIRPTRGSYPFLRPA